MAIMFVVNVLVVVYNVWLKRMEMRARSAGGTCRWGSQLGLSFGLHRAIWTGDTAFFLVCGDITSAFALGFHTREDQLVSCLPILVALQVGALRP